MGKIYDISMKITNELPTLKITDDLIVTINNKAKTVLNVQAMIQENEIKNESERDSEYDLMNKALKLIVGQKKQKEIEALDLPLPEYKVVFDTIMEITLGTYGETPMQ